MAAARERVTCRPQAGKPRLETPSSSAASGTCSTRLGAGNVDANGYHKHFKEYNYCWRRRVLRRQAGPRPELAAPHPPASAQDLDPWPQVRPSIQAGFSMAYVRQRFRPTTSAELVEVLDFPIVPRSRCWRPAIRKLKVGEIASSASTPALPGHGDRHRPNRSHHRFRRNFEAEVTVEKGHLVVAACR